MKKDKILYFVLGLLVASTVVYAAYKYNANEVGYTPNNENFEVDNVESAIDELYNKCIFGPSSFSKDSWETIIYAVRTGNTSAYRVGDTKEIDLGDLGKHTVRIANMSTPSSCSGNNFSQTACGFVVEFADIITLYGMNTTDTNVGGWKSSAMRTYVNNDIYSSLPLELKNSIVSTLTISGHENGVTNNYSTNDKLYLPSVVEVYGSNAG